jgi:hypothetical protein
MRLVRISPKHFIADQLSRQLNDTHIVSLCFPEPMKFRTRGALDNLSLLLSGVNAWLLDKYSR